MPLQARARDGARGSGPPGRASLLPNVLAAIGWPGGRAGWVRALPAERAIFAARGRALQLLPSAGRLAGQRRGAFPWPGSGEKSGAPPVRRRRASRTEIRPAAFGSRASGLGFPSRGCCLFLQPGRPLQKPREPTRVSWEAGPALPPSTATAGTLKVPRCRFYLLRQTREGTQQR